MKTEEIALSRLVENEDNPRQIKASQFQKLVQSILVFPRMLTLRPIVVDATYKALGGNMRLKALRHIVTMDDVSIGLKFKAEGERLTDEMREALLAYWHDWQQQPTVTVVMADDLTEAQKAEFISKDNIGYGSWDYNQLANKWDAKVLQGWGMAVWGDQRHRTLEAQRQNGLGGDQRANGGTGAQRVRHDGTDRRRDVRMLTYGKQVLHGTRHQYQPLLPRLLYGNT